MPPDVSVVALTDTRESRAVELLREERAIEVEEAMASTYGGGMTKNGGLKKISEKRLANHTTRPERALAN
jgi:hypothetical protein